MQRSIPLPNVVLTHAAGRNIVGGFSPLQQHPPSGLMAEFAAEAFTNEAGVISLKTQFLARRVSFTVIWNMDDYVGNPASPVKAGIVVRKRERTGYAFAASSSTALRLALVGLRYTDDKPLWLWLHCQSGYAAISHDRSSLLKRQATAIGSSEQTCTKHNQRRFQPAHR